MSLTQAPEPVTIPEARANKAKSSVPQRAKLTAPQIDTLRAASEREDRLVAFGDAPTLKTEKTIAGLLRRGLLVEVPAKAGEPVWRHDEQGRPIAAAITQAGLAALQGSPKFIPIKPAEVSQGAKDCAAVEMRAPTTSTNELPSSPEPEKGGPKRESIIALLRRQQGASVSEMMAITGWLPHTTRAALTGLRHKGLLLERSSGEDGKAVYRIVEPPSDVLKPAPQADQAA
jgi:hypothetical protein